MAITVPPVRGAGDLGHVDDSNVVRQALLDLDTAGTGHAATKGDVHGFRWDETVGRRLFAWDAVNGREQMIYGDTGWRDVSALMTTPADIQTLDVLLLRRVGSNVYLTTRGTVGTGSLSGTTTGMGLITLPTGFQVPEFTVIGSGSYAYRTPTLISSASSKSQITMQIAAGSTWGASVFHGGASFPTNDAWPTSLPGTASGPIPTGLIMDTAELLPAGGE